MRGGRQADGPDVVGEGDGTVQLHQGHVVVEGEGVVVRVRYDLLQVPLHHGACNVLLLVKAKLSFPGAGLGESADAGKNATG